MPKGSTPKRAVGFIGLGRMGYAMSKRLVQYGHHVYGFARGAADRNKANRAGVHTEPSLKELVEAMPKGKRILWMMVPNGPVVTKVFNDILPLLKRGDIVVQGGNDFYKEVQILERRAVKKGITVLDCGTSGGVHGLKNGFCLMIGGNKAAFSYVEPLFRDLAVKDGYGYFGKSGAGHFVKSVHNIIEYSFLQGIGEGMQMLSESKVGKIDLTLAAKVWRHRSVISSWLMDLTEVALSRPDFARIKPIVTSQTTQELIQTARATGAPAPAFRTSLRARKETRKRTAVSRRVINAIRREFGGHKIVK